MKFLNSFSLLLNKKTVNYLVTFTLPLIHICFINLIKTNYHEILQLKFFSFI